MTDPLALFLWYPILSILHYGIGPFPAVSFFNFPSA